MATEKVLSPLERTGTEKTGLQAPHSDLWSVCVWLAN